MTIAPSNHNSRNGAYLKTNSCWCTRFCLAEEYKTRLNEKTNPAHSTASYLI